jgi:hypothetical protein
MGLFGKSKPVEPPSIQRQDMATAVAAVPPKELEALRNTLPEIEYLSNALPADEQVLSAASCRAATTLDYTKGVIVFTPKRVVAVIGSYKKNPGGEPTVHIFPFSELTGISYAPGIINFGYFDVGDRPRVTLEIGRDKVWPGVFMDAAKQQSNRAKF